MDNLNLGDSVNFTSRPFGYRDKDKLWFVVEKSDEMISIEADDRFKLTYPHCGKHTVHISSKYWKDVSIKKKFV
jgi:hypothetical protein